MNYVPGHDGDTCVRCNLPEKHHVWICPECGAPSMGKHPCDCGKRDMPTIPCNCGAGVGLFCPEEVRTLTAEKYSELIRDLALGKVLGLGFKRSWQLEEAKRLRMKQEN